MFPVWALSRWPRFYSLASPRQLLALRTTWNDLAVVRVAVERSAATVKLRAGGSQRDLELVKRSGEWKIDDVHPPIGSVRVTSPRSNHALRREPTVPEGIRTLLSVLERNDAAICGRVTARLMRELYGGGRTACRSALRSENGRVRLHVARVVLNGTKATAYLRSSGPSLRFMLVRKGGVWKLNEIRAGSRQARDTDDGTRTARDSSEELEG